MKYVTLSIATLAPQCRSGSPVLRAGILHSLRSLRMTSNIQKVKQAIEKIPDRNAQRQDSEPVLPEQRQPFIPVGQAFVLHKFPEEDIAPDGAQPEGDRIKNQPEYDVFCCYFDLSFSFKSRLELLNLAYHEFPGIFKRKPEFLSKI